MKRKLLVLSLALSMFLAACGSDVKKEITAASEPSKVEKEETAENDVEEQEYVYMTVDELEEYFTETQLSIDNWQDYLEFQTKTESNQNAWGDITSSTYLFLNAKENIHLENCAIEVKYHQQVKESYYDKDTNQFIKQESYENTLDIDSENGSTIYWEDLEYGQYFCPILIGGTYDAWISETVEAREEYENEIISSDIIRITGSATSYSEIPKTNWNMDESGNLFIAVKKNNSVYKLYKDGHIEKDNKEYTLPIEKSPLGWDLRALN